MVVGQFHVLDVERLSDGAAVADGRVEEVGVGVLAEQVTGLQCLGRRAELENSAGSGSLPSSCRMKPKCRLVPEVGAMSSRMPSDEVSDSSSGMP